LAPPAPPVRRGQPAQPAPPAPPYVQPVPGPASLKFLTLTRCSDLVINSEPLPAKDLVDTWLLLADRCDDAARRDPRSYTSTNAEVLRGGIVKKISVDNPSDALLGRELKSFVKSSLGFPLWDFRCSSLAVDEASMEIIDAMAYIEGSAAVGVSTIARRLLHAKRTYPELMGLLAELPSPDSRVSQLERLSTIACPGRHSQTIHLRLSDLSEFITARSPLIMQWRNKAKTGVALIDLIIQDARETGGVPSGPVDAPAASGGGDSASRVGGQVAGISALELDRALQDDAFVQAAARIAAVNIETTQGKHDVLEIATGSKCVIFQMLFDRPSALKAKHEALGTVQLCMSALPTYLSKCQAVDKQSGKVPRLRKEWLLDATAVELLLKGSFSKVPLVRLLINYINLTASEPLEHVPDSQMYITESVLAKLGPFGHELLVAYGTPSASATGYTFKTLCERQRDHVAWIYDQGDVLRRELLPHADHAFRAALRGIDAKLHEVLHTPRPVKTAFGHLLDFGEEYDAALAAKLEGVSPIVEIHRALPSLLPKSKRRSLPGVVLESAGGRLRDDSEDDDDGERDRKKKKKKQDASKPGSKSSMVKWIDETHLRFGAEIYDIGGYVQELKLSDEDANALCWPFLLSRQSKKQALAFCLDCRDPRHNGVGGAAHRAPKGFDVDVLRSRFMKSANKKQRVK
jgi:hypothetical protein